MPEYRRVFLKGGTYFITIVTHHLVPLFKSPEARKYLHDAFVDVRSRFPFDMDAFCLLPDHIHVLMRLPEDDANYPMRIREIKRLFTKAYLNLPTFIFTRDDVPFVSSMEDLVGTTVAVVEAYIVHEELARKFPEINLLVCKNNKEALTAVSSGKAFAFLGGLASTAFMINRYGLTNLKASAPSTLPDATIAMGIRSDWSELRDIFNNALRSKKWLLVTWESYLM